MKAILEVSDVSKRYRIRHLAGGYLSLRERLARGVFQFRDETEEFQALTDVSFQVAAGESLGIIGRNGAGKSTLLKILARITQPSRGKIICRGRIASLLEVGTGFHPELTGRENIFFNGSLLGMKRSEIQNKFDEIIAFSGTEQFLDTALKHYSSGMQLRLAFAVAAFLEPEILIIDEVLAVGDAEFQKKCIGKMEDVSRSGRTILFVSHNMGAIKNLCSKTLVIDKGKVVFNGGTDAAILRYLQQSLATGGKVHRLKPPGRSMWINEVSLNHRTDADAAVYYGDDIVLLVGCMADMKVNAFLGFVIVSADGVPVINANNRYQSFKFSLSAVNQNRVRCHLGALPLMEGSYTISLYLGDESGDIDIVENAITFDVIERDIWGNGKLPPRRSSYLWWNTKFDYVLED